MFLGWLLSLGSLFFWGCLLVAWKYPLRIQRTRFSGSSVYSVRVLLCFISKAPATTPAPKFQPYPSEQNQPPGAHSPYIMKKGRTRWRQRAPYSYSQRPFLDAPYRQGPHKAPQSNQWSQHIEAAYNQRLREDAPYSQPLQHILFPWAQSYGELSPQRTNVSLVFNVCMFLFLNIEGIHRIGLHDYVYLGFWSHKTNIRLLNGQ